MQNIANRLVVLGTGGTIAGTAADPSDHTGYRSASLGIAQLLEGLPGLDSSAIDIEQVAQLDSKDMDHATWQQLAQRVAHHLARGEVGGIVISHGTDTLEETAYFLQRVLRPDKPVVITAAMRPATALQADGPQNLLDAAAVARWPGASGVLAVLAGQVIGAFDLRKLHPYRLDAFGSGDCGPIAVIEQGRLRQFRDWPGVAVQAEAMRQALTLEVAAWPWVEIVTSHAGADPRLIDALVAAGVRGLVVAGTGNGTVHRDLGPALQAAMDGGVAVVRSTRCVFGALVGSGADELLSAAGDKVAGLAGAGGLTPVQARVELMLRLMGGG